MELEWVIYHLIHNDDENFTSIIDLDIDLCRSDDDQWNRLILGLSRNRTIQSIELLRGYQNPIITEDDLRRLFTALRCCTKLSKVKLDSFTINDLEQTESLFKNNTLIEEVWIENAHFQRDDDDDEEENGEDNHDADGGITDDNDNLLDDYTIPYDHLIMYIATMSAHRLRRLRIEIPASLSHDSPLATVLDRSSKLEILVLETTSSSSSSSFVGKAVTTADGDDDDDDDDDDGRRRRRRNFSATMLALRSNKVLRIMDMDFPISFSDLKDVATMLEKNNTLTDLSIRLDPTAIIQNNDYENNNNNNSNNPNESIRCFFGSLRTNTDIALKHFTQYNTDNSGFVIKSNDLESKEKRTQRQELIDMALEMLECNLSLESFSFFLFDPDFLVENNKHIVVLKKKDMFLRLNQRGRKYIQQHDLRETVSKSKWIDQLAKHTNDDLDGLYYYICTNPSVCRVVVDTSIADDIPIAPETKRQRVDTKSVEFPDVLPTIATSAP
jgi:hypothetical protein